MTEIKLCKDCKWSKPQNLDFPYNWIVPKEDRLMFCYHPELMDIDYLHGKKEPSLCHHNRDLGFEGECMPRAKYFEKKT